MLTTDPVGYSSLHRIEPKVSGLDSRYPDNRAARVTNSESQAIGQSRIDSDESK